MTHTEKIIPDKQIIIVTIDGEFDLLAMNHLAIQYRRKALDLGYRLICDLRTGKNRISVTDALKAVRKYDRDEYKDLIKVSVGVVAEGSLFIFFKVVEQFITNARGEIKVFNDLDKAMKWFGA